MGGLLARPPPHRYVVTGVPGAVTGWLTVWPSSLVRAVSRETGSAVCGVISSTVQLETATVTPFAGAASRVIAAPSSETSASTASPSTLQLWK